MQCPPPLPGARIELSHRGGTRLYVYVCEGEPPPSSAPQGTVVRTLTAPMPAGCQYTTSRRYHARVHIERIHVNKGKAMTGKRKFALQDGEYGVSDIFKARKVRRPWPSTRGSGGAPRQAIPVRGEPAVVTDGTEGSGACPEQAIPGRKCLGALYKSTGWLQAEGGVPRGLGFAPTFGPDVRVQPCRWIDVGSLPDGARVASGAGGWLRMHRAQGTGTAGCGGSHALTAATDARPGARESAPSPFDTALLDSIEPNVEWDRAWC